MSPNGSMPEPDNTGFLLNLLKTHSGLNWLIDYFYNVRMNIVDGKWDDAAARQQFKDAVMKSRPQSLLGTEIREDTIDWERLYNECWETTKPRDDWGKQKLRERLERRGIDPDEFGWDLTLTGEKFEYEWEKTKRQIKEPAVVKVQFQKIRNLRHITKGLASEYRPQVGAAAPVVGALWMRAYLHEIASPPAPSPVGAHLVNMSLGSFEDLPKHLRADRKKGIKHLGRGNYEAWTRNILDLAADPNTLLALSVALFSEGQMTAISSSAQDVLLRFLSPIVEAPSAPLQYEGAPEYTYETPNAEVVGILHAGQVPFLISCHPSDTLGRWWSHLEAATALLVPQVIIAAEAALSSQGREIMLSALAAEVRRWKHGRPQLGEVAEWEWLPKLM